MEPKHDLTSQNPHEVWMAIGPKDRMPKSDSPPLRIVRFGEKRFELGLETHELEGTRLRVYSVARTIVDLFRYRHKIGIDVALEAFKEGWQEKRFTLKEINDIASLVRLDAQNTRMKDYFDLDFLLAEGEFDPDSMKAAIRATFKRRSSAIPTEVPTGLSEEFAATRSGMWEAFLGKNGLKADALHEVVSRIRNRLKSVWGD